MTTPPTPDFPDWNPPANRLTVAPIDSGTSLVAANDFTDVAIDPAQLGDTLVVSGFLEFGVLASLSAFTPDLGAVAVIAQSTAAQSAGGSNFMFVLPNLGGGATLEFRNGDSAQHSVEWQVLSYTGIRSASLMPPVLDSDDATDTIGAGVTVGPTDLDRAARYQRCAGTIITDQTFDLTVERATVANSVSGYQLITWSEVLATGHAAGAFAFDVAVGAPGFGFTIKDTAGADMAATLHTRLYSPAPA